MNICVAVCPRFARFGSRAFATRRCVCACVLRTRRRRGRRPYRRVVPRHPHGGGRVGRRNPANPSAHNWVAGVRCSCTECGALATHRRHATDGRHWGALIRRANGPRPRARRTKRPGGDARCDTDSNDAAAIARSSKNVSMSHSASPMFPNSNRLRPTVADFGKIWRGAGQTARCWLASTRLDRLWLRSARL